MVSIRHLAQKSRSATGAVGAQLMQALASLVLSIAAARALGADGLGVYGLISGGLVLTCAIATGLIGDSLTVLDRKGPHVRAGLQSVGLSVGVLAGVVERDPLRRVRAAHLAGVAGVRPRVDRVHPRGVPAPAAHGVAEVLVGPDGRLHVPDRDLRLARRRGAARHDRHDPDPDGALHLADRRRRDRGLAAPAARNATSRSGASATRSACCASAAGAPRSRRFVPRCSRRCASSS